MVGAVLQELREAVTPVWVATRGAFLPCLPLACVEWQLEVSRCDGQPRWPVQRSLRKGSGGSYSWHGSGLGEWACEVFVASQVEWELLDVGEQALSAIDAPMHISAFRWAHEVRPAGQGLGARACVLTS